MKKKYLTAFMLIPIVSVVSCGEQKESNYIEIITNVHDGDTFTDSHNNIYRLYGVDTPEVSNQYDGFVPTTGLEAQFGNSAKLFAQQLIEHHRVNVRRITTDRYKRVVAAVQYKGKDLATELISHGLARVAYIDVNEDSIYNTHDYTYYKSLLIAQHKSYMLKLGFWAHEDRMKEIFPKAAFI